MKVKIVSLAIFAYLILFAFAAPITSQKEIESYAVLSESFDVKSNAMKKGEPQTGGGGKPGGSRRARPVPGQGRGSQGGAYGGGRYGGGRYGGERYGGERYGGGKPGGSRRARPVPGQGRGSQGGAYGGGRYGGVAYGVVQDSGFNGDDQGVEHGVLVYSIGL